jgi:hypothetical protein
LRPPRSRSSVRRLPPFSAISDSNFVAGLSAQLGCTALYVNMVHSPNMCKFSRSDYSSPGHSSKGTLFPSFYTFFRLNEPPKASPGIPISYPENRVTNVSDCICITAATQSNETGTTSEATASMPAHPVLSEFAPGASSPKLVHEGTKEKVRYEMA